MSPLHIFHDMFRALKHKNFAYFISGQIISLCGSWMQTVALSWLVYRLTNSPVQLGAVNFCNQIPVFLLVLIGGMTADRFKRHSIVVLTQLSHMVLTATLATLTLTDTVQIWQIYLLSILGGTVNAFDMPARQSLMVELVGKEDLPNAIVLNSTVFNGARLFGPALAGFIIAEVGEGWCFALNSVSYLAVIAGLLAIRLPHTRRALTLSTSPWERLASGYRFVSHNQPIVMILVLLGSMSLFASPQIVLTPVIARDVLHGNAQTLSLLMSFAGAGAVIGALCLACRTTIKGLEVIMPCCAIACGLGFMLFSFSEIVWLSALLMAPIGIGIMGQMASSNTLIQSMSPDNLRGRVMAFHAMMFMGMAPVGALITGYSAKIIGAQWTFFIAGVCLIAGGAAFLRNLRSFRIKSRRLLSQVTRLNQALLPLDEKAACPTEDRHQFNEH